MKLYGIIFIKNIYDRLENEDFGKTYTTNHYTGEIKMQGIGIKIYL